MFAIDSDFIAGAKESFALKSQGYNLENFDFWIVSTPWKSLEG